MSDKKITINEMKMLVERFVNARDWHQFHSPKNLVMSLSIEAAELMELFQWLDLDESIDAMLQGEVRENATEEIADVMIYALAFCNNNNIDISTAITRKMEKNKKKYPADKFQGHF